MGAAGRLGGGGMSPRHSPAGSLCGSLTHPPPPQRQGKGFVWAQGSWHGPGEVPETPHSHPQGPWGKGEQVSEGLGHSGHQCSGLILGHAGPSSQLPHTRTPGSNLPQCRLPPPGGPAPWPPGAPFGKGVPGSHPAQILWDRSSSPGQDGL